MLPNWDDQEFYMKVFHFQVERALTYSIISQSLEIRGMEENQEIVLCANKEHLIAVKVTIL